MRATARTRRSSSAGQSTCLVNRGSPVRIRPPACPALAPGDGVRHGAGRAARRPGRARVAPVAMCSEVMRPLLPGVPVGIALLLLVPGLAAVTCPPVRFDSALARSPAWSSGPLVAANAPASPPPTSTPAAASPAMRLVLVFMWSLRRRFALTTCIVGRDRQEGTRSTEDARKNARRAGTTGLGGLALQDRAQSLQRLALAVRQALAHVDGGVLVQRVRAPLHPAA